MMACGGGGDLNACDSISGPKLRPVFPRPTCVNARYPAISPMVNPSFRNFTLYPNLSSLNPHPAFVAKQSSTKINEKPFTSSRWYPTAEQLLTLEELYRRGTRTPTVEQIQEIAAYLGRFGKIQGKNVFYWFQNHKARERRKLRREMGLHLPEQQHKRKSPDNREPVTRRTDEVILAKKKWATFLDSQRLSEGSDNSMGRAATAESMTIEGLQFEERKSKQSRRTVGRPGTWQIVPMPWSPLTHQSLIRTSSDTKFSNTHYVMPLAPTKTVFSDLEDQRREPKTLNLFPPHVCGCDDNSSSEKDKKVTIPTNENNFVPNRFFEFLPLKS